jgi:CheY-like chemotaxis protein
MSILLVDDMPDNNLVLEAMLRKAGLSEISTASSAQHAYQILGIQGPVLSRITDLILMDVMMPQISGIEACKTIHDHPNFCDVPIIMVTARSDMECLEEAFNAGAIDYINKPIRKLELIARVRSALKLKHETDERKNRELELVERNEELQKAMNEIKVLQGFLPVCAYCRKIRDVQGFWHQMEAYLSKHSELQFSHGICEGCLKHQREKMLQDRSNPTHDAA